MAPHSSQEPFSHADVKRYEVILKALGDRYRLRILALLKQHKGEISVEEITTLLADIDQSTVSFHLKRLRLAGLIDARKNSRHNYYFIVPEPLVEASMVIRDLTPGMRQGKKSA